MSAAEIWVVLGLAGVVGFTLTQIDESQPSRRATTVVFAASLLMVAVIFGFVLPQLPLLR